MKLHKEQQEVYDEFKRKDYLVTFRPRRWGKTALAIHIAVEQIKDGKTVYINNELSANKIIEELDSRQIKYNHNQILTGERFRGRDKVDLFIEDGEEADILLKYEKRLSLLPCIDEFKKMILNRS